MMNTQNDIDGGSLPQNYDDTPSAFSAPAPDLGAVPADAAPAPGLVPAAPGGMAVDDFQAELTPPQLIAIGSNINRGMTLAGQQIVGLQRGMVCGAVALGFLLLEARKVAAKHKMTWKKCFITRGAQPEQGQFTFSYGTALKYTQTAMAVYERAAAAGRAVDLFAQVRAYLHDAMTFDTPARGIPVLGELIDKDAISVAQVMVELGIIKPGKHAALPPAGDGEQTPILPGLEATVAARWAEGTRLVGKFKLYFDNDLPSLNAAQRGTLREELTALLAKLDDFEKAAPGL